MTYDITNDSNMTDDIIIDSSMTDDIIMTRARQLLHTYYDNNYFWSKTEAR
jgi:hypothetical protein